MSFGCFVCVVLLAQIVHCDERPKVVAEPGAFDPTQTDQKYLVDEVNAIASILPMFDFGSSSEEVCVILDCIQTHLDDIQVRFKDVAQHLNNELLRMEIIHLDIAVRNVVIWLHRVHIHPQRIFIAQLQEEARKLKHSLLTTLKCLVDVAIYGETIFDQIRDVHQRHRRHFLSSADSVMQLIKAGAGGLAVYFGTAQVPNTEKSRWRDELEGWELKAFEKIRQIEAECKEEVKVEEEMDQLMRVQSHLDNQHVAFNLHSFLTDKYDTKFWLVIAFNQVAESEGCSFVGFRTVGGQSSKRAAAISFDRDHRALAMDKRQQEQFAKSIEEFCNYRSELGKPYSRSTTKMGGGALWGYGLKAKERRCVHHRAESIAQGLCHLEKDARVPVRHLAVIVNSADPRITRHADIKVHSAAYHGATSSVDGLTVVALP